MILTWVERVNGLARGAGLVSETEDDLLPTANLCSCLPMEP